MKNSIGLLSAVALLNLVGFAVSTTHAVEPGPKTELLWPTGAPGAKGNEPNDKPAMTVYLPAKEQATRTGVVVLPGGGYWTVAIDHEGRQVARWLNDLGIAAFVVDYRHRGKGYGHPAPIQDAQRAIRTVRSRSSEFTIDPNKIGVIGFSAGGHLASTAGTHFNEKFYEPNDQIDSESPRPDFMILIYPVISMNQPLGPTGCRTALLGRNAPEDVLDRFSNEKQVTADTPPTFLVHTTEDKMVPVENSVNFYLACRKARVPAEMHIWQEGEHGFGLGKPGTPVGNWPAICAEWLAEMQLCKRPDRSQ